MILKALVRNRKFIVFLVVLVTGLLAWELDTNLIITRTSSLEHSVFYKRGGVENLKRGDYVMFSLKNDKYAKPDDSILKKVACFEGDWLKATSDKKYYCNGVYLNKAKDYSKTGEKLDNFVYDGIIAEGLYFVTGHHKDSYDSRYFGFISKDQMDLKARPFF